MYNSVNKNQDDGSRSSRDNIHSHDNHKIIYDENNDEWICEICGRVLDKDYVESINLGSTYVNSEGALNEDVPLFFLGLGTMEYFKSAWKYGERDDLSILSNIADKLELPKHMRYEFFLLYKRFLNTSKCKKDKSKQVFAAKLALYELSCRYGSILDRYDNKEYVDTVIELNFAKDTDITYSDMELDIARRLIIDYGIDYAMKFIREVLPYL